MKPINDDERATFERPGYSFNREHLEREYVAKLAGKIFSVIEGENYERALCALQFAEKYLGRFATVRESEAVCGTPSCKNT